MKIEQLSVLVTVVIAFVALATLVLTGQTGLRQDLRALQAETLAGQAALRQEMQTGQAALRQEMQMGQAELRAGQVLIRKDLAALGSRLAVVEHRTDALEARLMVERRSAPWSEADAPAAGPDSTSPAGPTPGAIPSR